MIEMKFTANNIQCDMVVQSSFKRNQTKLVQIYLSSGDQ